MTQRKVRMSTKKSMMREQKIYGIALIIISLLVPTAASLLTLPLGIWMLFTKNLVIV